MTRRARFAVADWLVRLAMRFSPEGILDGGMGVVEIKNEMATYDSFYDVWKSVAPYVRWVDEEDDDEWSYP